MPGLLNVVYVLAATVAAVMVLALIAVQYKRCSEGRLLVVYGRGLPGGFVVLDSGRFVLPLIQNSYYLSLAPVELADRSRAGYPRAVRIGRTAQLRRNAIQLLGLSEAEIVAKVDEILEETGPNARLGERLSKLGLEIA